MAALPYMQIIVGDYFASTMHLTTEEHGAYMLILMHHWNTQEPVCRGGSDDIENLVVACRSCNRSKGAKLISEWRAA